MSLATYFRSSAMLMGVAAACFWGLIDPAYAEDHPNVAAASDLKFALTEISEHFSKSTGKQVKLTFGSSGVLKTQIENGAPYELFLSADETFVFSLVKNGLTKGESRLYAIGHLALFVPHSLNKAMKVDIRAMLASIPQNQDVRRFSVANPAHAPYGRAARSVMKNIGLWDAMQAKLVFGENASQAMQFVTTGASQGGVVPLSLSSVPELSKRGRFYPIPPEWHADEPLRQRMVLLKKSGSTAEMFFNYVQGEVAQAILKRYGFRLPSEQS